MSYIPTLVASLDTRLDELADEIRTLEHRAHGAADTNARGGANGRHRQQRERNATGSFGA